MWYLGFFSISFEKIMFYTEILTWKVELWIFSLVSLEKKHHKTTFQLKISVQKIAIFSKTNGCVRVFQMKYLTIYILKLLFTMKLHLNFFWLREKAILRFVQRASCQGMAKKVEILQEDQDNTRPWKTTHVNLMKPAKWKKSRTYSL